MKVLTLLVGIALTTSSVAFTDLAISRNQYIETWSSLAVKQMAQYKIPASIKLAQAVLESANGNSRLAIKGKNHFGIKCHGWKGKEMYLDDDEKDECFRVYKTVEDSYSDHSNFLRENKRYAFLFEYDSDDYKSWARGLKKAGYATNPKYPQLLISIIEELGLDKYDTNAKPKARTIFNFFKKRNNSIKRGGNEISVDLARNTNKHIVKIHRRGVRYIVVKTGDTFYSISKEFGLQLSQLYRYNSFDREKCFLVVGDVVYIERKRRRRLFRREFVVLKKSMPLTEISQTHAINIKTLQRLNKTSDISKVIVKGEQVTLR